jgi:hypothetical protein
VLETMNIIFMSLLNVIFRRALKIPYSEQNGEKLKQHCFKKNYYTITGLHWRRRKKRRKEEEEKQHKNHAFTLRRVLYLYAYLNVFMYQHKQNNTGNTLLVPWIMLWWLLALIRQLTNLDMFVGIFDYPWCITLSNFRDFYIPFSFFLSFIV